jgi:ABC-2 type transport system permease protein
MNALRWSRPRVWVFLGPFLLPLPMLFLTRHLLPEGTLASPRLVAGAVVFSVGLTTVQSLAQTLNGDRFTYRLTLIRTCPVHQCAYAFGIVLSACGYAMLNACAILLLAPLFGISIHLSPWYVGATALTAVSLSGLALLIGTLSPSEELGNTIAAVTGIFIVLMSPIFFPVSRLPDWMEPLAQVSPFTHAANALDDILSGRGGFHDEIAIMMAITAVTMSIGLSGMKWREN